MESTMDMVMGLAMLLGIAPALILMFTGVRNYTYPKVEQPFFSDPSFFILFVAGMIEGAVIFLAMTFFRAPSSLILMALMAVIQIMAMVVVLNLRRYRGKSDSIFYGFGLGLGNACGLASGFVYLIYGSLVGVEGGIDASIVMLLVISVSMAMILGSCGTTVGEGIARHRVMEFALQALLPLVAYNMLLFGTVNSGASSPVFSYALMVLMLVLSGMYYYYIMKRKLPSIVREVLRMEGKKRDDLPK